MMCIIVTAHKPILTELAQWLERRTGITEPQVRALPEGLWLYFRNCSLFDLKIVYKISFYHHL